MSGLRERLQGEAADLADRLRGGEFGEPERVGMRSRIRRGRAIRTARTACVAVVAVGILGAGGWGLRDLFERPDIANPPEPTNVTTPSVTPTPSASPSASHDWSTVAAGDLPPAFADADPHQPASRQMQDWVWDYVDDSWTVATYGSGDGSLPVGNSLRGTQVMYLVAPDNTLFHLLSVPQDLVSTSTTGSPLASIAALSVERFLPAQRSAIVRLCPGGDSCQALRLNLTTREMTADVLGGELAAIMGPGYAAVSGTADPVVVWGLAFMERRANGTDAWLNVGYTGNVTGVFWGEDGGSFTASSLSAVVNRTPVRDRDAAWRGWLAPSRNVAVFLHGESDASAEPGQDVARQEMYLFDFAADTTRRIDAMLPAAEQCSVTGVIDDTSGVVACGPTSSFMGGGDTSKQKTYRFFFSGMTAPLPYTAQVAEVAWFILQPNRVLPEPKNPNPDAFGWVQ